MSRRKEIEGGKLSTVSRELRQHIGDYLEAFPDQKFFNRTDVMRATGRADNLSDPHSQKVIRNAYEEFGGTIGGTKVQHIRLTQIGFIVACERLGLPLVGSSERGKKGASIRWKDAQKHDDIQVAIPRRHVMLSKPGQSEYTRKSRKRKPEVIVTQPHGTTSLGTGQLASGDEFFAGPVWVGEYIARRREEDNEVKTYSIKDVFAATGRSFGGKRFREVKAWIAELGENQGVSIQHGRITFSRDVFMQLCIRLGQVDVVMSQVVRQRIGERRTVSSAESGEIFSTEKRSEVIERELEKAPYLPEAFVNDVRSFFLGHQRELYLIADLLAPLGRASRRDNKLIRARIRRATEEHGITAANSTDPLLVPLREAVAVCVDIGPKAKTVVNLRIPKKEKEVVEEEFIFLSNMLSHEEFLGLLIILRAPVNQAIRERHGIYLEGRQLEGVNNLVDFLKEEVYKNYGYIDIDATLPTLVKKFVNFSKRTEQVVFSEDLNRQVRIEDIFHNVNTRNRGDFLEELYANFTS